MRPVQSFGVRLGAGGAWRLLAAVSLIVLAARPAAAQDLEAKPEAPDAEVGAQAVEPAGAAGSTLEEAELDAATAEVAAELRCPVCRNQSVLESSAELSREMQATIRAKLEAGDSREEVKAYFVSRYGDWILLKPTARGFNLAVYALPALVLLLGGVFLVVRLRGWARRRDRGGAPSDAGLEEFSEDDRRWLEEAIRQP